MLVEARVANYRSFKAHQTFSLVADQGSEHLRTHSFAVGEREFGRLLRSAAIYGANSAGKTNLIRALRFMKEFVMNSAASLPNAPIDYHPYAFDKKARSAPSEFEVTFIEGGVRYEYAFSVDAERVRYERLIEYPEGKPRRLFQREYKGGKYFWDLNRAYLKGQKTTWRDGTKQNSLFLSVAVQQNSKQLLPAFEWFQKRLIAIVGDSKMNPTLTLKMLIDDPSAKESILPFLQEADPGISDLEITRESSQGVSVPLGNAAVEPQIAVTTRTSRAKFFHSAGTSNDRIELRSDDESGGALALFQSAGAWLNVLRNGEVLLFDEMDASLHPFLVRFLISQFHSSKTNRKNAQLVFSTHNSFILSQEIFRRDQIWFVEKRFSGESHLYPLAQFSPRKETDIQRGYYRGKYGALPILEEFGIDVE